MEPLTLLHQSICHLCIQGIDQRWRSVPGKFRLTPIPYTAAWLPHTAEFPRTSSHCEKCSIPFWREEMTIGPLCLLPAFPVPWPSAIRCRTVPLCYTCFVAMGPAAHKGPSPSCPYTYRRSIGKMQRKETGQQSTLCYSKEQLEGESGRALTRVAREQAASSGQVLPNKE